MGHLFSGDVGFNLFLSKLICKKEYLRILLGIIGVRDGEIGVVGLVDEKELANRDAFFSSTFLNEDSLDWELM